MATGKGDLLNHLAAAGRRLLDLLRRLARSAAPHGRRLMGQARQAAGRSHRAARQHLARKDYKASLARATRDARRRYPGLEAWWNQMRHAFSLGGRPSSQAAGPSRAAAARRGRTSPSAAHPAKKKTARKRSTSATKARRAA